MNVKSSISILSMGVRLPKNEIVPIAAVLIFSILLGCACGMAWRMLLATLGGISLFVTLVWDIRIVVPILILLLPLGPRFAMSFGNLYLSTAILIITYAAWMWRNPLLAKPYAIYLNRVVIAIAVFLGVLLVSSMQNLPYLLANKPNLMRFAQLFLYAGFFALVLQMSFTRRDIKMLLSLVLVAGFVEAIVALVRWRMSFGFFVHGTFEGGHSDFAVYAIMIAMLLVGVLLETKNLAVAIASFGAFGIMLFAIIFSFSRGGYVALAVSFVFLLAMPFKRSRRIALAGVFAVAILLFLLLGPVHILDRFKDIIGTLTITAFPISLVRRMGMWREALADFAGNPILGKGTWSYSLQDNFFIKVLGESGIVGLGAFVGLLVTILREEWRAIRAGTEDDFVRGLAMGLLPATVGCLLVFELSGDFFLAHRFMGSFWVVLALTLKYCLGIGVRESELDRRTA